MATMTAKRPAGKLDRKSIVIPEAGDEELEIDGHDVELTNLGKPFWPKLGITKGDLLQYYADVSRWLLPHLQDRAMVMKRYPHGIEGEFFFMKRAPEHRPDWIETCTIEHDSGNVIDFPVVQDLSSLLWLVNLGCIDLNPWYSRCDDIDRPDFLHFDLDPTEGATFATVRKAALYVHQALDELGIPNFAKTTGSTGIHVYVPIVRGPLQKQVWTFAKHLAQEIVKQHPATLTAVYRIAERPPKHVLVDYNQNAWGKTLASIYSVRPQPRATVSTPVTWAEIEQGAKMEEFCIDTVPQRLEKIGDCWKLLLEKRGRFDLGKLL